MKRLEVERVEGVREPAASSGDSYAGLKARAEIIPREWLSE
jgi:hypothetical protein